jgi:cytochrome P450 family 26 subfamily A
VEHKAHVVRVNNKNQNLQRLIIRISVFVDLIEQMEISETKDGAPLNWEDTRKMKYTWCVFQQTLRLQPALEQAFRICIKEFEYGGFTIPKGWKVKFKLY